MRSKDASDILKTSSDLVISWNIQIIWWSPTSGKFLKAIDTDGNTIRSSISSIQWATWATWPQWNTWARWATWATWPQWNTWAQWIQWIQWITWATWPAGSWMVDNLGNHIATINIRLWSNRLSYTWLSYWLKIRSNNNVQISGVMLEVSCGSSGANKWIKVWDDSYIYDDNCWGGLPADTLHIDSNDSVAITSNSIYGIYVNTNWRVWIGGSAVPAYGLDVITTGRFQEDLYVVGRLWIWTTSPSYNLQINTFTGDQGLGIFSYNWTSRLRFWTIGSYFANLWEFQSSPDWKLSIIRTNWWQLPAAITITSWNKVGIWTTSPNQTLVVSWTTASTRIIAWSSGGNVNSGWDIYVRNSHFATYINKWLNELYNDWNSYWLVISDLAWQSFGVGMRIAMQNMTQKAAIFLWKVGIWEDNPVAPLDVDGNIKFWQSSTTCDNSHRWEVRYDWFCFKWCAGSWRVDLNTCNAWACWTYHGTGFYTLTNGNCSTWAVGNFVDHNISNWTHNRTWTCTLNGQSASCRANQKINGDCGISDHYYCNAWVSANHYCHAHPVPDNLWDHNFSWQCQWYNWWTTDACTEQNPDQPSQAWCED